MLSQLFISIMYARVIVLFPGCYPTEVFPGFNEAM